MLLALGFNESQRELGTNQRNVGAELQQIRHAADTVVLGSHTYATGFDALVRSDRLDAVASVVSDGVVEQNISSRITADGDFILVKQVTRT